MSGERRARASVSFVRTRNGSAARAFNSTEPLRPPKLASPQSLCSANIGAGIPGMAGKDSHSPQEAIVAQASPRGLDARSLERIGISLKAHYDDLVRTPVPKKFLELLDQLEANEQASSFGSAGRKPE